MRCPVCRNRENVRLNLQLKGFHEFLFECPVCSSRWSVSHGIIEIVHDGQPHSFMQGLSESVESDDYNLGH